MGMLKKVAAAVAVKELVENVAERIEERRHPRPSLASRLKMPALLAAGGGALAWLYKKGKLAPVVEKIDQARSTGSGIPAASPDAPAAVTGETATGTSSTAQSV